MTTYQDLVTQTLEAKERAKQYVPLFLTRNNTALRLRGYRELPQKFQGIAKRIWLSHDHVIKMAPDAIAEWKSYVRCPTSHKKYLTPTMRLHENITIQPRGKHILRYVEHGGNYSDETARKTSNPKILRKLRRLRTIVEDKLSIGDNHNENFARFGDMVLCIDFAYAHVIN